MPEKQTTIRTDGAEYKEIEGGRWMYRLEDSDDWFPVVNYQIAQGLRERANAKAKEADNE